MTNLQKNSNLENHILALLGEECGELQQAVGKALRFGLHSNMVPILKEFHDILAAYKMLTEVLDCSEPMDENMIEEKIQKVISFMDPVMVLKLPDAIKPAR